jgi:hypothetical protein
MADEFGLTQSKHDYFAIWGWSYDQLWLTDQERLEEEFPPCDCRIPGAPDAEFWNLSEAAWSETYQKYAPVWEFACWIFDQLSEETAGGATHGKRWNETFLSREQGEGLSAVFSRRQLAEVYEAYGISAVYRIAIFAAAKARAGARGPLGRPTIVYRKAIERLQIRLSIGQALAAQNPLDRQIWELKGNGAKPASPAPTEMLGSESTRAVSAATRKANPDLVASFFAKVS